MNRISAARRSSRREILSSASTALTLGGVFLILNSIPGSQSLLPSATSVQTDSVELRDDPGMVSTVAEPMVKLPSSIAPRGVAPSPTATARAIAVARPMVAVAAQRSPVPDPTPTTPVQTSTLPQPPTTEEIMAALPRTSRIVYPRLEIDAPIVPSGVTAEGLMETPAFAVGLFRASAEAGSAGNVALAAHNDIDGALFRRLTESDIGDQFTLYRGAIGFVYEVKFQVKVWETGAPADVRRDNARFLLPTTNPICTLITCTPLWVDTHRWIVRAMLVASDLTPRRGSDDP